VAAGLKVFFDQVSTRREVQSVDKTLIDGLIAELDKQISGELNDVMHHPTFQQLESSWRGLKLLVDRTDFRRNNRIEILPASKEELRTSFKEAPELIQSDLYERIYRRAYDQPGAFPYSAMISNYEFDSLPGDIELLERVSKVAAAAHCPFIGAVG